jgi:hypothetical protein
MLNSKEPVFVEMQWSMMVSYSVNFERAYVKLDDGIEYEFFIDNVPTVLNGTRRDWDPMTEYECRFISTAVPVGKHPIIIAFSTSNPEFIVSNYYCPPDDATASRSPTPSVSKSPTGTNTKSPTETATDSPIETHSKSPTASPTQSITDKFSESNEWRPSDSFTQERTNTSYSEKEEEKDGSDVWIITIFAIIAAILTATGVVFEVLSCQILRSRRQPVEDGTE